MLQPLASVARARSFEVRRVRFTHSPYWHTSVTEDKHVIKYCNDWSEASGSTVQQYLLDRIN